MEVLEHTGELDGLPVYWREAPGEGVATVYLHDVPMSSDEWLPFLERETGPAIAVDLPGFGRTGKPGSLTYDLEMYDAWIERFLDHLGLGRVNLAMHGWGVLGLLTAQRLPDRFARLALIAPIPLLPGFRWTGLARAWRVPVLGEVAIGMDLGPFFRRRLPPSLAAAAWRHFDPGTQRALLRLYRSGSEEALARAGERLRDIGAPSLIACGASDSKIDADFADAYGARMPGATVVRLAAAGHWPWLDEPGLIDQVLTFLRG